MKNFIDTGAGVIDADYRGQVKILLFNHSDVDFEGWFSPFSPPFDIPLCRVLTFVIPFPPSTRPLGGFLIGLLYVILIN